MSEKPTPSLEEQATPFVPTVEAEAQAEIPPVEELVTPIRVELPTWRQPQVGEDAPYAIFDLLTGRQMRKIRQINRARTKKVREFEAEILAEEGHTGGSARAEADALRMALKSFWAVETLEGLLEAREGAEAALFRRRHLSVTASEAVSERLGEIEEERQMEQLAVCIVGFGGETGLLAKAMAKHFEWPDLDEPDALERRIKVLLLLPYRAWEQLVIRLGLAFEAGLDGLTEAEAKNLRPPSS